MVRFPYAAHHPLSYSRLWGKYAGTPTDTADLVLRDGRWWLHVVVTVQRKTETQRRIHSWSFAQLKSFIEYKVVSRCMPTSMAHAISRPSTVLAGA